MPEPDPQPPSPLRRLPLALWLATGVAAAALLLDLRRHQRESERLRRRSEAAERELVRSRDERKRLDIELNPHFVFSSLHAASALIGRDTVGANRVLTLLGDVIRGALLRKEAPDLPLEEEIAGLAPILEIETVRFGDELQVRWEVEEEALDARVPPRLLHALLESLIQHGSVRAGEPRRITIAGRRRGTRLELELTDPSVTALDTRPQLVGPGTDFVSLAERLAAIYGDAHALQLHARPDTGARITVSIPWQEEETTPDPSPTPRP